MLARNMIRSRNSMMCSTAVCTTAEHTVHECSEDNLSMIVGSGRRGTRSHQSRLATRLQSATGDDMEVLGSTVLRCKCGKQAVEIIATKSLSSATKLLSARCVIDLRPTQSILFHKRGGRTPLQSEHCAQVTNTWVQDVRKHTVSQRLAFD